MLPDKLSAIGIRISHSGAAGPDNSPRHRADERVPAGRRARAACPPPAAAPGPPGGSRGLDATALAAGPLQAAGDRDRQSLPADLHGDRLPRLGLLVFYY